jgi:hypothetical protein
MGVIANSYEGNDVTNSKMWTAIFVKRSILVTAGTVDRNS